VRQTEDWLAGLKRANGSLFSPTSVNNFRSRIHSRQACGVKREHLDRNVLFGDEPPGIYTVDQLSAMLATASPEVIPAFVIDVFARLPTAELMLGMVRTSKSQLRRLRYLWRECHRWTKCPAKLSIVWQI
jgi:hypothetical protein